MFQKNRDINYIAKGVIESKKIENPKILWFDSHIKSCVMIMKQILKNEVPEI